MNVDAENSLYIATKKRNLEQQKARDVRGGLFRGAGPGPVVDPYNWSAPGAETRRKKIIYWQKQRSKLEAEWV
ncbi:MAG: hypothetical protein GWN64_10945, partial [Candidatus Thorarchaeota archaeon]|nr:hypothetical protein [Candidatus Thorarchaeota archaeon]